ncbi:MAG: hypothetical protein D6692_03605 [Planctomycetota bacterium]|nr:MAG: hypothetical protein D6692_03605 [Planctomycetota bacterium]
MRAVGELEREKLAIEDQIRSCQARILEGRREVTDILASGRVDLSAARLQAAATLRDDQEARRGVLELAAIMRKLETARRELGVAAARRRAMELLRDRERERFLAQQNHREQTALDDLMIMRQRGDS